MKIVTINSYAKLIGGGSEIDLCELAGRSTGICAVGVGRVIVTRAAGVHTASHSMIIDWRSRARIADVDGPGAIIVSSSLKKVQLAV